MGYAGRMKRASFTICALLLFISVGAEAQVNYPVHGYFSAQYRYRETEDATDQDAYQYLSMDFGDPLTNAVTGHFFGRMAEDLMGNRDKEKPYKFAEITDTNDNNFDARLYMADLDINRVPGMEKISVGRQFMYDTPVWLWLDGVRAETAEIAKLGNLKFGGYGGLPVHMFEPNQSGNSMYGAYAQARPWLGSRIRMDWVHADNEYIYGAEHNNLYSLEIWQIIQQYLTLNARYTMLAEKSHDVRVNASYYNPGINFQARGTFYELIEPEKNLAIDFDPYFAALHEYFPYWQAGLIVSQGLGEHFIMEGGADVRRLSNSRDRSQFNHEFERYYMTLSLLNLPVEGLDLSVTGSLWNSHDQTELLQSYGGDISYRITKPLKASVGTFFDLYQYNYYLNKEEDNVQTYYARLSYLPLKGFGGALGYEYEDTKFGNFNVAKVDLRYAF